SVVGAGDVEIPLLREGIRGPPVRPRPLGVPLMLRSSTSPPKEGGGSQHQGDPVAVYHAAHGASNQFLRDRLMCAPGMARLLSRWRAVWCTSNQCMGRSRVDNRKMSQGL